MNLTRQYCESKFITHTAQSNELVKFLQLPTRALYICSSDQQTPMVGYHGEIRWRLLSPAFESLSHCGHMQHQVGSTSNSPGHSLLNLALLFLLVTAPDFGTFDPVLVSLHPLNGQVSYQACGKWRVSTTDLPSWCSQRQSGQKTKLHFEELH